MRLETVIWNVRELTSFLLPHCNKFNIVLFMHFTQKLYQNQVISTDELMEVSTNTTLTVRLLISTTQRWFRQMKLYEMIVKSEQQLIKVYKQGDHVSLTHLRKYCRSCRLQTHLSGTLLHSDSCSSLNFTTLTSLFHVTTPRIWHWCSKPRSKQPNYI